MALLSTKSTKATEASKSAINMFTTAIKKLEESNNIALEVRSENETKIAELQSEANQMNELVNSNAKVIENLKKLLS